MLHFQLCLASACCLLIYNAFSNYDNYDIMKDFAFFILAQTQNVFFSSNIVIRRINNTSFALNKNTLPVIHRNMYHSNNYFKFLSSSVPST